MRYVVKSVNDRMFHFADAPYTRSYCPRLRGALVVVDSERASEWIADRTATVCTACRTALNDRQAAARAMEDTFMLTATAEPTRSRPVAEPTLFDMGDAGALPLVGVETLATVGAEEVIAAGVPAVDGETLPALGVEAVIAADVPVVGGCCSCGEAIERPLNGPRPACTHEGTTRPDGSVVVGGYRVTPKGRGRCFTDRHDVDGVVLYEVRNAVARCGECVAADLGVAPCELPGDFSELSGAHQGTGESAHPAVPDADVDTPTPVAAAPAPWPRSAPCNCASCAAGGAAGSPVAPFWDSATASAAAPSPPDHARATAPRITSNCGRCRESVRPGFPYKARKASTAATSAPPSIPCIA